MLTDRATSLRPLYWRVGRRADDGSGPFHATLLADGGISLESGTTLFFDTYFSSFFEAYWRQNTHLHSLVLTVQVAGACSIRLRRHALGIDTLVAETHFDGLDEMPHTLRIEIPDQATNFREQGRLWFEVTATAADARFISAAWVARAPAAPVSLGIVFCTFNREPFIAAVLASFAADAAVLGRLDRVFVVNQGRPNLADHDDIRPLLPAFGSRLKIIEQPNFGGAGGFTRGLLETLDDPALTHCAFLDDDIRLEPDIILRMIAFLSIAKDNVAVGGQMLDGVQPMRLYEAGAVIATSDWFPRPMHHNTDIASPDGLNTLSQQRPTHFNGWWCFAVSLEIVRRVGLPLPCFIRGDDAEFGMRLYRAGITTAVLPGVAVWHEPFYLKLGGWQLYYETRNLLVLASLHGRFAAGPALRRMTRLWALHLLTFRYYSAALVLRGIRDFLAGPSILHGDPRRIHANVLALRGVYAPGSASRRDVFDPAVLAPLPKRRSGYLFWFVVVLLRNALAATAAKTADETAQPRLVPVSEFSWVGLRRVDHIVLDNWWEPDMTSYQRDRGRFRRLCRQAMPVMSDLFWRGNSVAAAWRKAAPELTSATFWRHYLGTRPD